MRRRMMKSKIHRTSVTDANLNYVGSIAPDLVAPADIRGWEQVAVLDLDTGGRFETYAICGQPHASRAGASRTLPSVEGPPGAARRASPGGLALSVPRCTKRVSARTATMQPRKP
jgi:aspartate 1-decarboxylase